MTGEIIDGRTYRGPAELSVDVVVCGGGAGGSMVASELAAQGARVVLLEKGGDQLPHEFTQREDEMFPKLFERGGALRTRDLGILVLAGCGLGGSTIHNTNLCKRLPDAIADYWRDDLGLRDLARDELADDFSHVEAILGVRPITDVQVSAHNRMLERGAAQLGYATARLSHNRDERCIGSGFCELGCTYDGKLNARRVLIPRAIDGGAQIFLHADIERIEAARGQVRSVHVRFHGSTTSVPRLTIRTRTVCLAAGALGSPALAQRSGLDDPHRQHGRGLHLHPGAAVAGFFDEPIEAWRGIPQSVECTEWLDVRTGSDRRTWIVPSYAHPCGTAALLPLWGPPLMAAMSKYPYIGALAALVHDETEGTVGVRHGEGDVHYAPSRADREQLVLGVRECAKLLLAAGARRVLLPLMRPTWAETERALASLSPDDFLPNRAKLSSVHPMGTMRMSADPKRGVCDERGQHHHVRGLFIADAGLFPSSIGGPPQLSVYTFALRTARSVRAYLDHGRL